MPKGKGYGKKRMMKKKGMKKKGMKKKGNGGGFVMRTGMAEYTVRS